MHAETLSKQNASWLATLQRIGLYGIILVCALAVFVLEPKHYPLTPANGNIPFAVVVSAVLLVSALLLKRSTRLAPLGGLLYAFFIASMVNLSWDLLGNYESRFLQNFGTFPGSNRAIGLGKVYELLMTLLPVLVFTWLEGGNLASLYLKAGVNKRWGWGIGLLVLFNFFTSVMIFYGQGYPLQALGPAVVWGLVFSLSNSMLEELWVRGLFFKKLLPALGGTGTVLVTALWFGAMHSIAVAYLPAFIVPIFLVNTFTLGLACGILMLKTESIWGAWLVHAAADLFLFLAMLAVH